MRRTGWPCTTWGPSITFAEIDVLSNKFAHFLKKSGLEPGDVVGVNLPNIPAFYIAVIGIQKAGCVLSGVSPLLTPEELEYQLNDSEAKALVTLDALFGNVQQVAEKTGVRAIAVAETGDFLPFVKADGGQASQEDPDREGGSHPRDRGGEISGPSRRRCPKTGSRRRCRSMPPIMMQYTGGTTGPPKGAVLSQKNFVRHFTQIRVWLDSGIG